MWPILFVISHYCSNLLWVGVHVFLRSVLHLTKVFIACYSWANESEDTTPSPCFMPFCFNTPRQFTLLFNLCLFVFGLTLWLVYFHIWKPFFHMGISFLIYSFLIYAYFFRNTARIWNKVLVSILTVFFYIVFSVKIITILSLNLLCE